MVIRQGEIYWLDVGEPLGSAPGYRRPFVVIQNDVFNRSAVDTVVICVLTSNLKRAEAAGNILLQPGEAGLPRQSVVNVSQIYTVDKQELLERIGSLSFKRVLEILEGIQMVLQPREVRA
ncbi:MAG: type II toxin-antitoxin system PemK/MazF family toxin [Candidatus Marinimicrobia bacterium]|nr:type II toxin-antitoxin system PemK/MazF family toxin [Candidatus Neomarinimicrobiota bacterium]